MTDGIILISPIKDSILLQTEHRCLNIVIGTCNIITIKMIEECTERQSLLPYQLAKKTNLSDKHLALVQSLKCHCCHFYGTPNCDRSNVSGSCILDDCKDKSSH